MEAEQTHTRIPRGSAFGLPALVGPLVSLLEDRSVALGKSPGDLPSLTALQG